MRGGVAESMFFLKRRCSCAGGFLTDSAAAVEAAPAAATASRDACSAAACASTAA